MNKKHTEKTKIDQNQGIQVIARAAAILRVLKNDNLGLSLGQIAERTSLARSTVQRIVHALQLEKLVMTGPDGSGIRLGAEIQALAAAGRIDIVEQLRPLLTLLSEETQETVDLTVFKKDHLIFIDQIVGKHRLRAVATIGESFPMTSTANGKACLALLEDHEIEAIINQEMRSNGQGIENLGLLLTEIEQIRQQGFALDLDEHTQGISAAGIGFHDRNGQLYAISVPGPSYRFNKKIQQILMALDHIKTDLINLGMKVPPSA